MKSCIIKIVMLLTFIIALPLTSNASEKLDLASRHGPELL